MILREARKLMKMTEWVNRRLVSGDVLLSNHEVAKILRGWADVFERADALNAALDFRYAADAFDTADYGQEPGEIVFRSLEKIRLERAAETQYRASLQAPERQESTP